MRKDTLFLSGTSVFATVLALLLWSELRESRRRLAILQQEVSAQSGPLDMAARPLATNAQQPRAADLAATAESPSTLSAPDQASPITVATQYPGCDEATLASTGKSAATSIAQWAADLQLLPDEVQRLTEARLAEMMARLPCASTSGSSADLNQLQEQFLAALGPARLEKLLDLNAERNAQGTIWSLSLAFRDIDVPLRDEQSRELRAFLLEENRRTQREALRDPWPSGPHPDIAYLEGDLKKAEERARRILAAAQPILDPEQFATLRESLMGSNELRRSSLATFRRRAERGEKTGITLPVLSLVRAAPGAGG